MSYKLYLIIIRYNVDDFASCVRLKDDIVIIYCIVYWYTFFLEFFGRDLNCQCYFLWWYNFYIKYGVDINANKFFGIFLLPCHSSPDSQFVLWPSLLLHIDMLDRVLERSIFYNLLPRDGKLSIARSNLRHLRNPFWKITKQVFKCLNHKTYFSICNMANCCEAIIVWLIAWNNKIY